MNKLRERTEYDGNPVGLDKDTAVLMGRELDKHLAAFHTLYSQYHKHHWLVEGPQFRDLHHFFEENYDQIHKQYDKIAERLTVMGIAPTCKPENKAELSYIEHEQEGVYGIRDMLKNDMVNEREVSKALRETIELANEKGDYATKAMLEKILYKTEDRCHHLEHFLGKDSVYETHQNGAMVAAS